jgi:hypothetical protein
MDIKDSSGFGKGTYEYWDYEEEERKQREAQALIDAQKETEQVESTPEQTPGDVARTGEKEQLDDGIVTKIGEGIGYLLKSDGLTADVVNAAASGLNQLSGGNLQGVDDFFMGSEEQKAAQEEMYADNAERRDAGEMNPAEQVLDTTLNAVTGVAAGTEAGLALPFTLGARVANQNAPWSDPPEILKNSPVGQSVMKITEILVPTLLTGGILGGSAATLGVGGVVAESALETIPQRAADDLIAGRTVAAAFGDIANNLGLDGNQLTLDMIEGKKPNAQVLNAAVGFMQNLGINVSINQVLKYFAKPSTAVEGGGVKQLEGSSTTNRPALPSESFDRSRALNRKGQPRLPGQKGLPGNDIEEVVVEIIDEPTVQAAKALGKDPEEVAKAVNDVQVPQYRADAEPSDVFNVDNFTNTARPSKGNKYMSEEAMMREIMRRSDEVKTTGGAIGQDGLNTANRSYFTNWDVITTDESLQAAFKELTKNYRVLDTFGNEALNVMIRAKKFWQNNKGLLEDGPEGFAKAMYDYGEVEPIVGRKGMSDFENIEWKRAMREEMGVTPEGFTIMSLAAEELGVRISKMGRMINQLEFGGIDFTKSMEVYIDFADKVDLLLVPLRRAKRKWSVAGFAQQNNFQKQVSKEGPAYVNSALKDYAADPKGSFDDLTKIGFDDADPGMTLREMWEKYKAGDAEAGKTLKAYIDFMGNIPPSGTIQQMRMMNQIINQYMKNGSKEGVRALWYATMLATLEPIKAAFTGGALQVLQQPLGNMARGGIGQAKNMIPGIYSKTGDLESKRALQYGIGQFSGLMTNINSSVDVLVRSFKNNELIHNTQRLEGLTVKSRKQKMLQLEFAAKNVADRMTRENASDMDKMLAGFNFQLQRAGLSPQIQIFNRALTALDQAAITAVGNSEAMAQGMVKAWEDGVTSPKGIEAYIKASTESIFEDGLKNGRVKRADILETAQSITFQADIPMGDATYNVLNKTIPQKIGAGTAGAVDTLFKQVELGSKNSAVLNYFNPFIRVNYNFLDVVAMKEPTGFLASVVPRYRAIISGQMGEAKEMQLKSGIAFTQLMLAGFTGIAMQGGMQGKNPDPGMEEYVDSFIVPWPLSPKGFIAVPFARIQPYAQYLSGLADTVNGFKRNVINTTQYDRLVSELLVSIGLNTLDSSFQQGWQKMARFLDTTNIQSTAGSLIPELVGTPLSFARLPLGALQPYETMQGDKVDGFSNFITRVSQRATGGIGNPIQYNRYTGEPILKAGKQGAGYWEGVGNNLINILGYPGLIKDAGAETPVFKEMQKSAYDTNKWNNNNRVKALGSATKLTTSELSTLDQLTGDPKVGALQKRLVKLFNSGLYKNAMKEYQKLRKDVNPVANLIGVEDSSKNLLGQIHGMIDAVHNEARSVSLAAMIRSGDYPKLIERREATNVNTLINFSLR